MKVMGKPPFDKRYGTFIIPRGTWERKKSGWSTELIPSYWVWNGINSVLQFFGLKRNEFRTPVFWQPLTIPIQGFQHSWLLLLSFATNYLKFSCSIPGSSSLGIGLPSLSREVNICGVSFQAVHALRTWAKKFGFTFQVLGHTYYHNNYTFNRNY